MKVSKKIMMLLCGILGAVCLSVTACGKDKKEENNTSTPTINNNQDDERSEDREHGAEFPDDWN